MSYAGMTQEQILVALQNDNAQMKAEMMTMKQLMEQATAEGAIVKGGDWRQGRSVWEQGG